MATSALDPGTARTALRFSAARLIVAVPFAVMLIVSAAELLLADRKFGLFSGGFGMSRAVDSGGEMAVFFAGFISAQALAGLAGWAFARRVTRRLAGWAPAFVFAMINGALVLALLAAQYQLASYFSDAVGFALLKQLGGGSLVDALLFGLSEIGVAVLALAVLAAAAWAAWRLLGRVIPAGLPRPRGASRAVWLTAAGSFAVLAFAVPRSGSDAAYALNRTLAWGAASGALDLLTDPPTHAAPGSARSRSAS